MHKRGHLNLNFNDAFPLCCAASCCTAVIGLPLFISWVFVICFVFKAMSTKEAKIFEKRPEGGTYR